MSVINWTTTDSIDILLKCPVAPGLMAHVFISVIGLAYKQVRKELINISTPRITDPSVRFPVFAQASHPELNDITLANSK